MPAFRQIGGLYNHASGASIPIIGVDEIDIAREQSWDFQPLGRVAGVSAVWQGSQPIEYSLNFELLAGYGEISDRAALLEATKKFHAMGSHRFVKGGALPFSPPAVTLVIYKVIDQVGFFKNVRTVLKGPWGGTVGAGGGNGFTEALPTVVQFSGVFCFVPGYNSSASELGVDVSLNSEKLGMDAVEKAFYTFNG